MFLKSTFSILLLICALISPLAAMSQDLSQGERLLSESKYRAAINFYWPKASMGNARAMEGFAQSVRSMLIIKYHLPTGFSAIATFPYYLLAANAGIPNAQNTVCGLAIPDEEWARIIPTELDLAKAISYCYLAAAAGHEIAKKNIAHYQEIFPKAVFIEAKKIADDFEIKPLPSFEGSPPLNWN